MRKSKSEIAQHKLDIAAMADANEGIRQGLEEARSGKGRPVREFFAEFRAKAWQHFLIQERA